MTDIKQFFMSHLSSLQGQVKNENDLLASWGNSWQKLTLEQKKLVSEVFHKPVCLTVKFISVENLIGNMKIEPEPTNLINRKTGAIWVLTFKQKYLKIDVPNFSFQIYSCSPTQFKPIDPEMKIDIEFDEDYQSQNLLMHLYAKGIRRATFEAL
ncbi:MAG: hypothetical protein N4J56_001986 [Chroococcidiopsis sp. SAG 2025]|uniref:hypothetical protein n=1 Tax=Chroococcidiopsis sp. SAG 2025 TaxID=171389 RepID=UPI0029371C61|nr:hypothetical protein [Chroococcidiopsis sp. SAG 2025]MDV2992332.1 hypothetical protein [Chroococcidiopsis sp. SAG 2025]